ncbi:phosphoglucan phosphatase DSP4, chloroplastic-like isoform X2 [Selaginella moellendorffii]|uniref:phosphoglucan phosphatase DSP4, chloroplastic-like isoform X2 n=1 Tax=Selaginella moellendorffii TaxID=88036 RepID=UPI000D1C24B7|nr:phosphoglucan phosphatase DSP4, chloroplastic-like isoform X2 [Selaginella moellendorffii]|eukprot:XP_024526678.1 phosphoglucan phosphatase DSP4, chloroplastic-like isoform X2 [Selaginella moellendorffii]
MALAVSSEIRIAALSPFPSPPPPPTSTSPSSCSFLQASYGASKGKSSIASIPGKKTLRTMMKVGGYAILPEEESPCTLRERMGRGLDVSCRAQSTAPATETEQEGWEKRQNEAENGGSTSSWHWTLNWNEITSSIVVGSCPRSPDDVDRIAEGCGVNAILSVQSDVCLDALKIPFESIKRRASERGVYLERVPIRDFDHGDQALMLPEAVRMLNMLVARGLKVYVHCTAGINRATLTVVGYLTFIQGMDLDDAVNVIRSARSIAHPYIDCWIETRRRLLDGRSKELTAVSRQIYECRCSKGLSGNSKSDWEAAQKQAITNTFNRWLKIDLGVIETELDLLDRQYAAALRKVKTEFERDMSDARSERNHVSFDYTQYVAAAAAVAPTSTRAGEEEDEKEGSNEEELTEEDEDEDEDEDENENENAAVECDVVTRQCVTKQDEVDLMLQRPLRWYLSRSH